MRDEDACQSPMAASKLLSGGSLPPRKRLLVGLKKNGWSISCSPSPCASRLCESNLDAAVVTATAENHDADGSAMAAAHVEAQKQVEEGCARCGGRSSSPQEQLRKGGIHQRFCSSCALLYGTNLCCPHCLGLYKDASNLVEASVWIACCRCHRSVHIACESKNHSNKAPDPLSYLCPNCSMPDSTSNSSREKLCTENKDSPINCMKRKEGGFVQTVSENLHLRCDASKKLGHGTEMVDLGLGHQSPMSASAGDSLPCKSSLATAPPLPQESAAAAKATAYMTAKVAAAARAKATEKAYVAAKAAAVARAALEAAVLAARAEERAREELSHRSVFFETKGQASTRIQIAVGTECEVMENIDEANTSVDDEELARQLHHAMNSSPRITRSATPSSKKIKTKNEVDLEGQGFAQGGFCSSDEPPPFPKPQLTRPRSSIQKENKRWEPRFSKINSAKLEREKIENALQLSTSEIASSKDEKGSGDHCHSSPSSCIEHQDNSMIVAHKLDAVISSKTSTNDGNAHNLKISFGHSLSPVVCEDRTKVGYKIKKIADVTTCKVANLSGEDPKAKKVGVSERHVDACLTIEDGSGAAVHVIKGANVNADSSAGNKLGERSQVLSDQVHLGNDRMKGQGAPEKKVQKTIDKQKIHNWKSVSKLLSSADNKRAISDTRTLSSTKRSIDNGSKPCADVRTGQRFSIKSNFKPFSGLVTVNQRDQFKGTVSRHEAKQLLPKLKMSDAEDAVSALGSLCKVTNLKGDSTWRHIDLLKTQKLASVANGQIRVPNIESQKLESFGSVQR